MTREIRYDLSRRPVVPSIGFYAFDATGDIDISAGFTDINFDTEVFKNSDWFTFTAAVASITINIAAWFKISYYISTRVSVGTVRSDSEARLVKDTGGGFAAIAGTIGTMYNRTVVGGTTNANIQILHHLDAGDIIKLQAQLVSGTNTILTLANAVGILIEVFLPD